MLLDRRRERAVLDRILADIGAGESRALLITGEAGIGKSALLEYLAETATSCRIERISGAEAEKELPFAGLHQLCRPLLDRLPRLPAPQRLALETAFGLDDGGGHAEPLLVGLAALTLLAEAAHERPLVCTIDDVQWLDRASSQVLGFAARRLRAESVALVIAARTTEGREMMDFAGLERLVVEGLPEREARALLERSHPGPADPDVFARIIRECRGNPLALLELPRGFTPAEFRGGFGRQSLRAVPEHIEESYRRQVQMCSDSTGDLLLLAAAEPVGDPTLLWRAARALGIPAEAALEVQEEAQQFIDLGAARVTFRHPLLRSALYGSASPADRRRVHGALSEVTDEVTDPDRRAWHRALAVEGTDDAIASELEARAERAAGRGGPAAAAAFLERASELTSDPEQRHRTLLAAAYAVHEAGLADQAAGLLARLQSEPLDADASVQARVLSARIAFSGGRPPDAPGLLLEAANLLAELEPSRARETYLEAMQAAWFVADPAVFPTLADVADAANLVLAASPGATLHDTVLTALVQRYLKTYSEATPAMRTSIRAYMGSEGLADDDLRWHWFPCVLALDLWEDEASAMLTERFVMLARRSGRMLALSMALTQRVVFLTFAGELDAAESALQELRAISESSGVLDSRYAEQIFDVWRGHERDAAAILRSSITDARARGEGIGLLAGGWMQALLDNSRGRYEDAFAAASQAARRPGDFGVVTWTVLGELVTAAAGCGQLAAGREALDRLRTMSQASGSEWALGVQDRCAALVAERDDAEQLFESAIERLGGTRIRGELARTHLHFGEWLRRQDQGQRAREQLRIAYELFTDMGMSTFASVAAVELEKAGENVVAHQGKQSVDLTTQEAQIARLVSDGLSNGEIAARMFLSPRTVEWHLSKVFVKLGITSRRQMRRGLGEVASDATES